MTHKANYDAVIMTEEEKILQAYNVFHDYVHQNMKQTAIAKKYGIGIETVKSRVEYAKKLITEEIKARGDQELAMVFERYNWLYDEARKEWESTKDSNYLKIIQGILKEMRGLFSLDAPGKLPKNDAGKTMADQQIIIVVNDGQYAEREKQLTDGNMIDGEVKVLKSEDEN